MTSRQRRFRAFADEVTPAVGAYLQRRLYPLTATDLDDLVEEVLIVGWRRFDDIPSDAPIPWMIGVARNVLRNAQRKERHRLEVLHMSRERVENSAEENVVADLAVREALAQLSDDDRDMLLLQAWDNRSSEDIAVIYGISSNAAAVRLTRAQDRFRKLMSMTVE